VANYAFLTVLQNRSASIPQIAVSRAGGILEGKNRRYGTGLSQVDRTAAVLLAHKKLLPIFSWASVRLIVWESSAFNTLTVFTANCYPMGQRLCDSTGRAGLGCKTR
jgi:hypothetical protein